MDLQEASFRRQISMNCLMSEVSDGILTELSSRTSGLCLGNEKDWMMVLHTETQVLPGGRFGDSAD